MIEEYKLVRREDIVPGALFGTEEIDGRIVPAVLVLSHVLDDASSAPGFAGGVEAHLFRALDVRRYQIRTSSVYAPVSESFFVLVPGIGKEEVP